MFESIQLFGAFACVGVLVLVGVGLVFAGGIRKSRKMAWVGTVCLVGAGIVLTLTSWYVRKCDEDREETRRLHVAEF